MSLIVRGSPSDLVDHPDGADEAPSAPPPATASGTRSVVPSLLHLLALVAVALLFVDAIARANERSMGEAGLVTVLPVTFLLALEILCISYALAVRHDRPALVLVLHVVMLIALVHGLSSFIDPVPRLDASWRHVGIIDYIDRTHAVTPPFDAYFSWPGFFALVAFVVPAAGLPDALMLARWAPIFFELLAVPPLLVIVSSLTQDRRRVWLGLWIFFAANWVGQDYFSPQAFTFFLYLAAVAVLLRSFRAPRSVSGVDSLIDRALWRVHVRSEVEVGDTTARTPVGQVAAAVVVVVIACAIVPAHQLTPFALLVAVGSLVVLRRITLRGIPLLVAVLTASWLAFTALPYVKGHLGALLSTVGDITENLNAGLAARVAGSNGHLLVVATRLGLSAAVWCLAAVGAVRGSGRRGFPVTAIGLAVAPFLLIGVQSYGGEILLRTFMFSLPFMGFLAAGALLPSAGPVATIVRPDAPAADARPSLVRTAVIGVIVFGLAVATVVSKYGNDDGERFTTAEVHAIDRLYEIADRDSLLVATVPSVPWKARHYDWEYEVMSTWDDWPRLTSSPPSAAAIARALEAEMWHRGKSRAFLVIERAQVAYSDLMGLAPAGWVGSLPRVLSTSSSFRLVYRNADAVIFRVESRW